MENRHGGMKKRARQRSLHHMHSVWEYLEVANHSGGTGHLQRHPLTYVRTCARIFMAGHARAGREIVCHAVGSCELTGMPYLNQGFGRKFISILVHSHQWTYDSVIYTFSKIYTESGAQSHFTYNSYGHAYKLPKLISYARTVVLRMRNVVNRIQLASGLAPRLS